MEGGPQPHASVASDGRKAHLAYCNKLYLASSVHDGENNRRAKARTMGETFHYVPGERSPAAHKQIRLEGGKSGR